LEFGGTESKFSEEMLNCSAEPTELGSVALHGRRGMLTVRDVAEQLGVGVNLVYARCRAGELRHYRFGVPGSRGKIAIGEGDFADFLAGRQFGSEYNRPTYVDSPANVDGTRARTIPPRHLKLKPARQG
jgi:excisionase family DNA binding protein